MTTADTYFHARGYWVGYNSCTQTMAYKSTYSQGPEDGEVDELAGLRELAIERGKGRGEEKLPKPEKEKERSKSPGGGSGKKEKK